MKTYQQKIGEGDGWHIYSVLKTIYTGTVTLEMALQFWAVFEDEESPRFDTIEDVATWLEKCKLASMGGS